MLVNVNKLFVEKYACKNKNLYCTVFSLFTDVNFGVCVYEYVYKLLYWHLLVLTLKLERSLTGFEQQTNKISRKVVGTINTIFAIAYTGTKGFHKTNGTLITFLKQYKNKNG